LNFEFDIAVITLQVKGYTNIFAVGDAVDVDDAHMAYLACEHANVAAKAIQTLTTVPSGKLPLWKRNNGFRMSITTLGKKNAFFSIGKSTVFTYVPGALLASRAALVGCCCAVSRALVHTGNWTLLLPLPLPLLPLHTCMHALSSLLTLLLVYASCPTHVLCCSASV
jgi:NADH dehydrogenase FAD-containing subunit